ncbi:MAG: hypothetical protein VW474_12120, partial [Paracoccaceae bacterium]
TLINDQESVLEPIMKKMESKNFSSEKSMINFLSKEFKKLIEKYYKFDTYFSIGPQETSELLQIKKEIPKTQNQFFVITYLKMAF